MPRGDAGPGRKLSCVPEEIDGRKLGKEGVTGDFPKARNAGEKFELRVEQLVPGDELVDTRPDIGEFLLLSFDATSE